MNQATFFLCSYASLWVSRLEKKLASQRLNALSVSTSEVSLDWAIEGSSKVKVRRAKKGGNFIELNSKSLTSYSLS